MNYRDVKYWSAHFTCSKQAVNGPLALLFSGYFIGAKSEEVFYRESCNMLLYHHANLGIYSLVILIV